MAEKMKMQPPLTSAGARRRSQLNGVPYWLFVLPLVSGTLLFNVLPMLPTLYLSFTNWDGGFQSLDFVGLANYADMLHDPYFLSSVQRTLVFTVGTIAIAMVLGLGLALLVRRGFPSDNGFRAIYFLPVITSEVAVGLVWRWILDYQFGPLNVALASIGITAGPRWLVDPNIALLSVIIVAAWHYMGYDMLLFLAGLQHISPDVQEAAKIDGADAVQRLFRITLPLLSPTTFFVLIINMIFVFQIFGLVFIMTDGGPGSSTEIYMFHLYRQAFTFFRMGYASAIAWVLFLILAGASALQFALSKRWVFYE